MQDIESSGCIEVTTHRDETDLESSKTPEALTKNVSLPVASTEPADKPAAETAFTETPASEVPPPIEVGAVEHTTIRHVFAETTQSEAAGSQVTITTSISAGNN